jgi:hypothetical protein
VAESPPGTSSNLTSIFSRTFSRRGLLVASLGLAAGIPRIISTLTLFNADYDAYDYIETVRGIRAHLVHGGFSMRDLAGFWFPLYQFICACISIPLNNPLHVTRLVSVVCGTAECLMIFKLTEHITGRRILAFAAFALVAFDPLQVVYSSYSMTEVPFALAVVSSLYLAVKGRWVAASIAATIAGLMRVEAWVLIPVIPALQYMRVRRISAISAVVLLAGPVVCLGIYWAATGHALEYFHKRALFVRETIGREPDLARFYMARVLSDVERFFYAANPVVAAGCVVALVKILKSTHAQRVEPIPLVKPSLEAPHHRGHGGMQEAAETIPVRSEWFLERLRNFKALQLPPGLFGPVAICVFYSSFLAFLILAYVTDSQPQIWTRYGLTFLAIGAPLIVWAISQGGSRGIRKSIALVACAGCVVLFAIQLGDAVTHFRQPPAQVAFVKTLREEVAANPDLRVLCDDPVTRVLSNLPAEKFLALEDLSSDGQALDEFRRKQIGFVVFVDRHRFSRSDEVEDWDVPWCHPVAHSGPDSSGVELWLCRVKPI